MSTSSRPALTPRDVSRLADFDGTVALKDEVPLKTWRPHVRDWREGDPTWKDGAARA